MKIKKNIVVIGVGYWGKNLVRCFNQLGHLRGIFDTDVSKMVSIVSNYNNLNLYQSIHEIAEDKKVDGVVIATPVEDHFSLAKFFLESEKNVFVEKPMTMTASEAWQLINLSEQKNKVLLVGHILEYHSAIKKMRQLINEGKIGILKEIYSHRLNTGKIRQLENVWWSFAPHDVLLILNTVKSNIGRISCVMSDYMKRGISDSTITTFLFENDVFAHIYVSWTHPFKYHNFVVVGTEGAIEFCDSRPDNKLRFYKNKLSNNGEEMMIEKGKYFDIEYEYTEPLMEECRDFLYCIDNKKIPKSSGHDGLLVIEVLEKAVLLANNL